MRDRIKIRSVETLSEDWGKLKKTTFDYRARNGAWETQTRETYDGPLVVGEDLMTFKVGRTGVEVVPAKAK